MTSLPLPEHGKFCDLDVPFENVTAAGKKLSMLVQLGYEVVAFSRFLESSANSTKKKKYEIPSPPPHVPLTPEMLKYFRNHNTSLMQFTRLTIELKQVDDLIKVRDALNMGRYDIIAVVPGNEQLFLQSCTELNIDIISLDCTSTFSYIPAFKLLSSAQKRGICFEINYSPMIRDASTRNCTVSNTQKLSRVRKFSNLILSSGCSNPMELRGPYDVANLNCLFGLPESSYIHTITKHCRAALVHGFVRKTAKGAVHVQEMTFVEQHSAEKELNNALELAAAKAKTEVIEKTKTVPKSDVTTHDSAKKKKAKKSKVLNKSATDSVQLVNVTVTNGKKPEAAKTGKTNLKAKEKKKSKKIAKSTTPTKDVKVQDISTDQSNSTKKKKGKKRKLEKESEKPAAKKGLLS